MYGKMQAAGLTEFIPFICTSAIWSNPVSLFTLLLASPQLLSNYCGGWLHPLDQFLESSFIFGGKKLLIAVAFLVN